MRTYIDKSTGERITKEEANRRILETLKRCCGMVEVPSDVPGFTKLEKVKK